MFYFTLVSFEYLIEFIIYVKSKRSFNLLKVSCLYGVTLGCWAWVVLVLSLHCGSF